MRYSYCTRNGGHPKNIVRLTAKGRISLHTLSPEKMFAVVI